jgi:hypothetical protein
MIVVSIGGIANDGSDYDMWLDQPFSQPSLRLEQTRREGGDSLITAARREAQTLKMNIVVGGATEAATKALRETLLAALDTGQTAIALVVEDDDGGDERYRYVVVQAVDEQFDNHGPGQKLVATLVTHGETRWRANTSNSTTWNVTASEETTVIANGGSLAARPVYTIVPTDAKVGADNTFTKRVFCPVKWPGRTAAQWTVDITDRQWDTYTLINNFTLYFGSGDYTDNIAVMVDGQFRKRWVSQLNTTYTSVWVNADWVYCPTVGLVGGFGSGDTVTEIEADSDIDSFPYSGILQIDEEIFTYAGKDNLTRTFHGVTRAAKGSAAATHTAGDLIDLIQHDIWLVYGGTGYWDNTYDDAGPGTGGSWPDAYKPMFDLEFSLNSGWRFTSFGQSDPRYAYRSMTWRPGGSPSAAGGLPLGTGTSGDPFDEIVLTNNSASTVQHGESYWWIPAAFNLASARIIGRGFNYEMGSIWQAGLYAGGGVYINIPPLEVSSGNELLADFDLTTTEERGVDDIRFYQRCGGAVEIRLDACYLQWATYPSAMMMPEISVYDMALTLENVTSGQAITLTLAMALNEQLEVDTENHTVRLLDDGSSQYQALERDTRRREMLPLLPGNNTLRVTEDGLAGVTIHVEFEERRYS